MSSANLDLVRSIVTAWKRGDFSRDKLCEEELSDAEERWWVVGIAARVTVCTDIDEGRTAARRLAESRG